MNYTVYRCVLERLPLGPMDDPKSNWHKPNLIKVGRVSAPSPADAIAAAKRAGFHAPVLAPELH